MNRFALLTVLFVVTLTMPAQAQGPFLPGQMRSQALAEWVWHPPCAHVGVSPLLAADASREPYPSSVVAISFPGACHIEVGLPQVIARASDQSTAIYHWSRVREIKIMACTMIVHEYGHLAGYYNPVGATLPDGTVDHTHSPDPYNVMSDNPATTYPPCRNLFPRS